MGLEENDGPHRRLKGKEHDAGGADHRDHCRSSCVGDLVATEGQVCVIEEATDVALVAGAFLPPGGVVHSDAWHDEGCEG